ncbi:carbohydrate kinase family protein [Methanobrevibacter filiformis]|uniref:Ribokinase n=1 Tax=Methanobrevibacter filiformis TaxID=55758 RepID=A0A166CVC7_9EURY|nr:PfkB family carbohydrate kinase [Methanobrevibacter filiformis]KZX17077.1 ribokinase [Methanobrevibacter filiformis]
MRFLKEKYDIDVIGFGALNMDNYFHVDEIAVSDSESQIINKDSSCGGSAANTIIGLSHLNINTSYIGKIAEDDEGETLEMNLISSGVYLNNLLYESNGSSGKVYDFLDENGNRALYVDPGVNDEISIDEIDINNVKDSKIIHYSSFVGNSFNAQNDLIDLLPASIILSFDPGRVYVKKGLQALEKILKRTNILLINEIELGMLFNIDNDNKDNENYKKIAKKALEYGIEYVIVKRGAYGVYGLTFEEEVEVSSFKVDVVDTTAAGDLFNTGFLYSYLKNYSLKKSCTIANWIASKSVENIGLLGIPNLNELNKFERELDN